MSQVQQLVSENTSDVRMFTLDATLAGTMLTVLGQWHTFAITSKALESEDEIGGSTDNPVGLEYPTKPIFQLKPRLIPDYLKSEFTGIVGLMVMAIVATIYGGVNYGMNGVLVASAPIAAGVLGLVSIVGLGRRKDVR